MLDGTIPCHSYKAALIVLELYTRVHICPLQKYLDHASGAMITYVTEA